MTTYQPTWRRPIADRFRQTAHLAVELCIRWGIHPNVVSCSSIAASAFAALCFWQAGAIPWLLIPAVALCYVRLWLNMLDGMVAIASGKTSRIGEIANELPDRISDVLIFAGVAHSGLCNPFAGYWVGILALLVAYVGTLGQAVGVQREFSGCMAKPWRMVALHLGAWVALAFLVRDGNLRHFWGITILDGALLAIIAGCMQTIVIRLVRIVRSIRAGASSETGPQASEA